MRRYLLSAVAIACCAGPLQAKDIKIGFVSCKTGALEAYAKQTQAGLMLGLEYATKGTMQVNGNKLVVIEKDDQCKPDIGKAQLTALYQDDKVDLAVGPTASGVALAMLPVALEFKKVLVVEPAVADVITGAAWNRYIFKTSRNSSMDAISLATTVDKDGTSVALFNPDTAFGKDFAKAIKGALKHAKIAHEEYVAPSTTDFTANAQRMIDALKDKPGRKVIIFNWAGASDPFGKLIDMKLKERYGIELATGGNILPMMASYKKAPGMEGALYYYYGIPKNPVNDWLISEHYKRFKSPPDFFTAGGMSAAIAVVEALKKTGGNTDSEKLIATMEGMSFETPKGKMTFRKEDHQALQSQYHYRIKNDPAFPWGVPELVHEIKPEEMNIPINNKR
jgi:branched-chain amino acid transport system substrate-binding protein